MNKCLSVAISSLAALAALSTAGAAHAADVAWSVGIGLPGVGAVISNGPSYRHGGYAGYGRGYGRGYYAPPPVYVPAPVYVQPRVVYQPAPVVYGPVPVVDYDGPVYRHRARPVPYRVWAPPLVRYRHGY